MYVWSVVTHLENFFWIWECFFCGPNGVWGWKVMCCFHSTRVCQLESDWHQHCGVIGQKNLLFESTRWLDFLSVFTIGANNLPRLHQSVPVSNDSQLLWMPKEEREKTALCDKCLAPVQLWNGNEQTAVDFDDFLGCQTVKSSVLSKDTWRRKRFCLE